VATPSTQRSKVLPVLTLNLFLTLFAFGDAGKNLRFGRVLNYEIDWQEKLVGFMSLPLQEKTDG